MGWGQQNYLGNDFHGQSSPCVVISRRSSTCLMWLTGAQRTVGSLYNAPWRELPNLKRRKRTQNDFCNLSAFQSSLGPWIINFGSSYDTDFLTTCLPGGSGVVWLILSGNLYIGQWIKCLLSFYWVFAIILGIWQRARMVWFIWRANGPQVLLNTLYFLVLLVSYSEKTGSASPDSDPISDFGEKFEAENFGCSRIK